MSDKEILDKVVGGLVIRDMTATTFISWMSTQLNGVAAYTAANQELIALVANPPMGRIMPDAEKIRLVKKLFDLGITL